MNRRGFLGAILASAMAPAIVKASSLMPIYAPKIITPTGLVLWGDGIHDDTLAFKTLLGGGLVFDALGTRIAEHNGVLRIPSGTFKLSESARLTRSNVLLSDSRIVYQKKGLYGIVVDSGVQGCAISNCAIIGAD